MVSNISFTSSAVRYLNNEPIYKKNESILNDAKEAAKAIPMSAGMFLGMEALGQRKILRFTKKGKAKVASGEAIGAFKHFKNAATNIAKEGAKIQKTSLTKALFTKEGLKTAFNDFKNVNKILQPTMETIKADGKITKLLKPITNSALGKKIKLPAFEGLCKRTGAGFMLAIDGIMEGCTEVVPAFMNGGAKEGFKQLGKSALKVGVSTGAWVLGEAAGQTVGAAIGSAICPGIGTAIGGFIGGLFGGMFASNVAANTVKKATGKAYSEKAQEQQEQQQAAQIANDPSSVNQIKQAVMEKLALKQQQGGLDKEDMQMLELLQNSQTQTAQPTFGSLTTTSNTSNPFNIDYSIPKEIQQKMGLV